MVSELRDSPKLGVFELDSVEPRSSMDVILGFLERSERIRPAPVLPPLVPNLLIRIENLH